MSDIDAVIGEYTGLSRTVLEFARVVGRLVATAREEPDFGPHSWAPLAELVAVDQFRRVGNFKEVMNWQEYIAFMSGWAPSAEWDCSFRRLSRADDTVFLELVERSRVGEYASEVNSLSVYEFDDHGRITDIAVYLQMELPSPELLRGYEGVDLSQ